MKRTNFLAISLVAVLFSFSACDNIPEPDYWANQNETNLVTLYAENFGNAATTSPWPSITEYTGFQTTGNGAAEVKYTSEGGMVSVRGNSSSNYSGASGECNAMMAAAGASLIINDIATCGAKKLLLSFGSNQVNDTLIVSYKVNGTDNWIPISYTKTTNTWELVENLEINIATGNTIKLKFAASRTQYGVRVDDIKITTTDEVGAPVIDPDGGGTTNPGNNPDPVSMLSEDFESFTEGNGEAYFSKQTDNKGWNGFIVTGTLEPDVRKYGTNKYVQFSAHRTNITTQDLQEMWLVSPRLDVSAATSKILSFETLGGYFSASTVFEAYVLVGDDPATAQKTKLEGWRIAKESDLIDAYTPYIPSGDIDLSGFSGVIRIGFYYKGTSGTGNSTTYQIDNFVFGKASITLNVSPTSLSFSKESESKTFTVTSNTTWNAVSSDQTNFAVATSGDIVTVTTTANTGEASRNATVTVTTSDGQITRTVSLAQAGNVALGTNLVNNGDFSAAWTSGIPAGWTSDYPDRLTVIQGNDSIIVTNPATGTTKFYQDIAVTPGTTYTISYEYKATHARFRIWSGFSTTAGATSGFTYIGEAVNDELRTKNDFFPVANAFTKGSHTFTVPSTPEGLNFFRLEFRYYGQAESTFGLRNVKLVQQ
jgi:Carbohydrate binding domain.